MPFRHRPPPLKLVQIPSVANPSVRLGTAGFQRSDGRAAVDTSPYSGELEFYKLTCYQAQHSDMNKVVRVYSELKIPWICLKSCRFANTYTEWTHRHINDSGHTVVVACSEILQCIHRSAQEGSGGRTCRSPLTL